jgi:hypothetical protein
MVYRISDERNYRPKIIMGSLIIVLLLTCWAQSVPVTAEDHVDGLTLEDITYSTFLGGSESDSISDVALDSQGNIVVVGGTYSTDFPVSNAYQESYAGGEISWHIARGDAIVAKFSPDGGLLWSTFLGGPGADCAYMVDVDKLDQIIVVGNTESPEFPVTEDALQPAYSGGESDGFLTVFTSDGSLLYSSFLGGESSDAPSSLDVYSVGGDRCIFYLAGSTNSSDFPVTPDAYQGFLGGGRDGFITVLSSNFSSILYSTFIGGTGYDAVNEVVVEGERDLVFSGSTSSQDFPIADDAFQVERVGEERDCYVAKFRDWELAHSTLFGGSEMDDCFGLATDSDGNVIIVGRTWSPDIPITADAIYDSLGEVECDGYLAMLSSDCRALVYSTYYGLVGWDSLFCVEVDPEGFLVLGFLDSGEFDLVNPFQSVYGGRGDIVLISFDDNYEIQLSSYLGGTSYDQPRSFHVEDGKVWIVGFTESTDFYVTHHAYQRESGGSHEGFIFMIDYTAYLNGLDEIHENPLPTERVPPPVLVSYLLVIASITAWALIMRRYFSQ